MTLETEQSIDLRFVRFTLAELDEAIQQHAETARKLDLVRSYLRLREAQLLEAAQQS